MPSLSDTFNAAAHSLDTYEQAIQVVGNNTTNATTPGFAAQRPVFVADSFTPSSGGGGVSVGSVLSSRDEYAEQTVQGAQSSRAYAGTMATQLQHVEGFFPLPSSSSSASAGGIGGMLNNLMSAFSSLTTSPNDTASRQAVLNAAGNLATAFNTTYGSLTAVQNDVTSQARDAANTINSLVSQIQQINAAKQNNASANNDAGVDAQLHADLENLSQLVNITTRTASDGTTSIFLGGQTPLLIGVQQYSLSESSVSGNVQITDSTGANVTAHANSGKLGALINLANTTIPSYVSQLNTLAQGLADTINTKLASGWDQHNHAGARLFSYNPLAPAESLAVAMTDPTTLAAASASAPGGNDNAVALSTISTVPQASLGNFSFTGYYGNLASVIGTDSANAQGEQTTSQQVLSQAQTLRSNASAVSLDQEATQLTEYQQAYNATSRLINVVDQMMQTVLNMVPTT
ncbi:MAG: flagellar hook-associated protein FlgK [Acidobacteriaceae bacterium]|nr:flagellar hook-associated protein FlgK [Acidobacteriaceae bacterium]